MNAAWMRRATLIRLRTRMAIKRLVRGTLPASLNCAMNTTMNTHQTYKEAGIKAGNASKNRDQGLVRHYTQWLSDALVLEPQSERQACRNAYDAAYKEASGFHDAPRYFA